ncbi:Release factor glutamine methyltransferase [Candidatus Zixiibacteriota bacterium]|nr:Release factor glutamine methyltransferase [candidate division Zixibacteria bacterium]
MDERSFHGLLKGAEKRLKAAGIESATAEVEIILEYLLAVERIDIYLHGATLLDDETLGRFDKIIAERCTRRPLQYILGEMYFYGRKFLVSPAVMVPTPETEILCDLAIGYIRNEKLAAPKILDIGAGSGVIGVTMACEIPGAVVTALDISPEALQIAEQNAARMEVGERVQFVESDGFTALEKNLKFDLILSNPPYISEEEYRELPPEVLADPRIALTSGAEGLDFIKVIIERAPEFLMDKGRLMFEIGYNQAERVAQMTENDGRYRSIAIMRDLNDIDRVVILSI